MNESQRDQEVQDQSDQDSMDPSRRQDATDEVHQSAQAEQADPSEQPESRDEELMRLRGEVDQANKRVLQAQADAENFRKRMRRDYEDQLKFAATPLVTDLLQVRDNLVRALEAASAAGDAESAAGLREGVAIVAKQLDETLTKHGITEIPAEGELFDPNFHEAISQMPSPDVAEGMIAHVAVTGFQLHDRVIRPAQVVVSSGNAG